MNYSTLSAEQRARVAYLFADDAFGTDPNSFEYEADACGMVTGRTKISRSARDDKAQHAKKKHHLAAEVTVRATPEEYITEEVKHQYHNTIRQFARAIAERSIQSQSQTMEA